MTERAENLLKKLSSFRYVFLVAAVGLVLILWPTGKTVAEQAAAEHEEEMRVASLLSKIEGVGDAGVLLSENGAVIVCPGAENASVCLKITQAVKCYTGLGADEVQIFKSE